MEVVKRTLTAVGNLQLARSSSQAALTNLGKMTSSLEETLAALAVAPASVARRAGLDALCFCPTFHVSFTVASKKAKEVGNSSSDSPDTFSVR